MADAAVRDGSRESGADPVMATGGGDGCAAADERRILVEAVFRDKGDTDRPEDQFSLTDDDAFFATDFRGSGAVDGEESLPVQQRSGFAPKGVRDIVGERGLETSAVEGSFKIQPVVTAVILHGQVAEAGAAGADQFRAGGNAQGDRSTIRVEFHPEETVLEGGREREGATLFRFSQGKLGQRERFERFHGHHDPAAVGQFDRSGPGCGDRIEEPVGSAAVEGVERAFQLIEFGLGLLQPGVCDGTADGIVELRFEDDSPAVRNRGRYRRERRAVRGSSAWRGRVRLSA